MTHVVINKKAKHPTETLRWHVRNTQGETFGPVDAETLKAWAMDARLAPSDQITGNLVDWMPASQNPDLEMNWVVEMSPGSFYGPIHRQALDELRKDGAVPGSAYCFMRRSLDEQVVPPVSSVSDEAIAQRDARIASAEKQFAAYVQEAERFQSHLQSQMDDLKGQLAIAMDRAKSAEDEVRAQAEQEILRAQQAVESQVKPEQMQALLADAGNRLRRSEEALEATKRQAAEHAQAAAAQMAGYEQAAAVRVAEANQLQTRISEYAARLAGSEEALEVAKRQMAEQEKVYAVRLAECACAATAQVAERTQLQSRISEFEAQLVKSEEALEAARRRVVEHEQARAIQAAEMNQLQTRISEYTARLAQSEEALEAAKRQAAEHEQASAVRMVEYEQARAVQAAEMNPLQTRISEYAARLARSEEALEAAKRQAAEHEQASAVRMAEYEQARAIQAAEMNPLQIRISEYAARLARSEEALEVAKRQVALLEKEQVARVQVDEQFRSRHVELDQRLERMERHTEEMGTILRVLREVKTSMEQVAVRDHGRKEPRHVYVEAEPVEVLTPPRKTEEVPRAKTTKTEVSMVDIERQARRELEQLGATGLNFLNRKK